MKIVLLSIHVIVTLALMTLILLQNSKGGLQSGAGGEMYRSRRGAERLVFTATIVLSVVFFLTSIVGLLIR